MASTSTATAGMISTYGVPTMRRRRARSAVMCVSSLIRFEKCSWNGGARPKPYAPAVTQFYLVFSIGVILASYCFARAVRSVESLILLKNSSMTPAPSTDAQPGAAGVSFELADELIRADANWSDPSDDVSSEFAGPRP